MSNFLARYGNPALSQAPPRDKIQKKEKQIKHIAMRERESFITIFIGEQSETIVILGEQSKPTLILGERSKPRVIFR